MLLYEIGLLYCIDEIVPNSSHRHLFRIEKFGRLKITWTRVPEVQQVS